MLVTQVEETRHVSGREYQVIVEHQYEPVSTMRQHARIDLLKALEFVEAPGLVEFGAVTGGLVRSRITPQIDATVPVAVWILRQQGRMKRASAGTNEDEVVTHDRL